MQRKQRPTIDGTRRQARMAVGQGKEERFLPFRPGRFLPGFDGQRDAGGMDAKRSPQQGRHPPAGEPGACTAKLRFKGHEVAAELCGRPGAEFPKNASAPLNQSRDLHGKFVGPRNWSSRTSVRSASLKSHQSGTSIRKPKRSASAQRLRPEILLLVVIIAGTPLAAGPPRRSRGEGDENSANDNGAAVVG